MTRTAVALLVAFGIAAPSQEGAQVSGRVVDDRGVPVPGASVYLIGGPLPGARPAITTEDGRFAWRDISPATYAISIAKAGYPAVEYGQSRPDGPGTPITIQPGQSMALEIRLPRGAVIAGRVIDDAGDPAAGRQIVLSRPSAPASPIVRGRYQVSNSRGEYRLFGLSAGTYGVGVAPPSERGLPASAPSGSVTLTVAAGEEREGVDLRASLPGRTTYVTIRPVAIDGQPLRLPQVRLRRPGESRAAFSYGTRNPDGSSTIGDVPAGQYKAVVEAGPYWGAADLAVDGEHPVSSTVTLTRGVRIRGQLAFDGPARPSERFFIHLASADLDGIVEDDGSLMGQVGPDGSFAIAGVPPGHYVFQAQSTNGTSTLQSARIGDADATDIPVTIGADDIADVRLTMTGEKSGVRGAVTGKTGAPLNGVDLVAYPADARLRTRNSRRVATARTGIDGGYELPGLPPGDYLLAVVQDPDREALKDPAVVARLPPVSSFTLGRGETRVQNVTLR